MTANLESALRIKPGLRDLLQAMASVEDDKNENDEVEEGESVENSGPPYSDIVRNFHDLLGAYELAHTFEDTALLAVMAVHCVDEIIRRQFVDFISLNKQKIADTYVADFLSFKDNGQGHRPPSELAVWWFALPWHERAVLTACLYFFVLEEAHPSDLDVVKRTVTAYGIHGVIADFYVQGKDAAVEFTEQKVRLPEFLIVAPASDARRDQLTFSLDELIRQDDNKDLRQRYNDCQTAQECVTLMAKLLKVNWDVYVDYFTHAPSQLNSREVFRAVFGIPDISLRKLAQQNGWSVTDVDLKHLAERSLGLYTLPDVYKDVPTAVEYMARKIKEQGASYCRPDSTDEEGFTALFGLYPESLRKRIKYNNPQKFDLYEVIMMAERRAGWDPALISVEKKEKKDDAQRILPAKYNELVFQMATIIVQLGDQYIRPAVRKMHMVFGFYRNTFITTALRYNWSRSPQQAIDDAEVLAIEILRQK